MPSYIVADIRVIDPDGMQEYGKLAYPTLVAAGGKMLAIDRQAEIIEGDWQPGILVLIEFPTADDARKWLESPEYQPALKMRTKSAKTNLILMYDEIRKR
jgi:uncharacterized protein (DUF1330 family)